MKRLWFALLVVLALATPAPAYNLFINGVETINAGSLLAVADGGTGTSTLADGGIVVGNGTSAVEVVSPGATTTILVGGGAATNPVWTTATGSGAPVRATSPTIVTPAIDTINESTSAAGVTIDSVLLKDGAVNEYESLYIPAASMYSTTTNGATPSQNEYATNDINKVFHAFNGATEQFVEFDLMMPEKWNRGTIKVKFFWSSASGSTAGDTVEWEIQGGALSNDDALDAALGTAQVISDALLANNGTDLQVSGATPAITVGGSPALGDLVHFKVSRNVGGTDDMTEDAWLFGAAIQYFCANAVTAW